MRKEKQSTGKYLSVANSPESSNVQCSTHKHVCSQLPNVSMSTTNVARNSQYLKIVACWDTETYLLASENGLAPYISIGIPHTTRNAVVNCAVASDSITHTRTEQRHNVQRHAPHKYATQVHSMFRSIYAYKAATNRMLIDYSIFMPFHSTSTTQKTSTQLL